MRVCVPASKGKGSPEFEEYNAYVEECVAWGKAEKAKYGL